MPDTPEYVYDFNFSDGLGAWTSWLSPSLIRGEDGDHPDYVRLQAPGTLDPNHVDGIGALWLVSHLSIPVVGSPGILDLRDAEIDITIRGTDFDPNGAMLVFWVCTYLPEQDIVLNYPVGLQVTNWAHTGGDFAGEVTDDWQTITVRLSDLPEDWTYAGNNVSAQGDWADRYEYLDLDSSLSGANATLHLVMVTDSPDQRPSGFLDIADITVRTHAPATPTATVQPDLIAHGVEDEPLDGSLATPDTPPEATYSLVAGSVRNGTVEIDPETGDYTFVPAHDYYGPTDFVGPAGFQYVVTDENGASAPRTVYIYVAPINDAPTTAAIDESVTTAIGTPLEYSLFYGSDVDADTLHFSLVPDSALHGTVEIDPANGRYIFTPDAGFAGDASFQYIMSDGQLDSAPKTVVIHVVPEEDAGLPDYADVVAALSATGDTLAFARDVIRLADAGDPNASYHYGTWLRTGHFVAKDTALAAHYLEQAVGTVPDATLQLAALYTAGDGVARDYAMARELLESLPSSGEAEYRLGLLDRLGFGGPQDSAAAAAHFTAAVRLGSADAMLSLGRAYLAGDGVDANPAAAYFWIAAAQRFGAGPALPQIITLENYNLGQAAALLTQDQLAILDGLSSWTPGQALPVFGSVLADTIGGTQGDDLLIGFDGDDRLLGLGGSNVLDGGAGNDTADYSAAAAGIDASLTSGLVVANGFGGSDQLTGIENLTGSAFNDLLVGSAAANVLLGGEGNDYLIGLAGNDVLNGGDGSDTLQGGLGDDTYYVTAAGDTIVEFAGEGLDTVLTGLSDYTLVANVENLGFIGGGGFVGRGNDLDNVLTGGDGDDRLLGFGGNNVLDGGAGDDTADYSAAAGGVTASLNSGVVTANGFGGIDQLVGIERLTGSAFDDTLIGSAAANILLGGDGHDYLIGLAGNDTLVGGGGSDMLQGGLGDDTYYVTAAGDTIVEFADEGLDTVLASLPSYTLAANVENLRFIGDGGFVGRGNDLDNVLTGGGGDDRLSGLGGNNVLDGGAGNDTADYSGAAAGISASLNSGIVAANGFGGSDQLTNIENLSGSAFDDILVGSATANILRGGGGHDMLFGLDGDDVLDGGDGFDDLFGGAGRDEFRFSGSTTGLDRIHDFESGQDRIALDATVFTRTGDLAFVSGAGAAATSADSTFLYDPTTGILSYDADGNGAGAAISIVQLNVGQELAASDLLFY